MGFLTYEDTPPFLIRQSTTFDNTSLAMAFKLLMMAEKRWRKVNSPHLVAVVQAGFRFPDGQTQVLPDTPKSSDSFIIKPVEVAV